MIEIDRVLPLANLSTFTDSEIAVKARPGGGFVAYLDFINVHTLDHREIEKGIGILTKSPKPPNSASQVGWGFWI